MDLSGGNSPNRPLADGIRRVGFRKWYERELLSSHAHMILALLSLVAMVASFEAFRGGSLHEQLLDAIFLIASGAIGWWSMRRYLFLFMRAEEVANQASCGDCGAYGRFRVVGDDSNRNETQVRCSKCEHLWTICT
jgi:predicted Zn finger-like uncharacterized protein